MRRRDLLRGCSAAAVVPIAACSGATNCPMPSFTREYLGEWPAPRFERLESGRAIEAMFGRSDDRGHPAGRKSITAVLG